MTPNDECPHLHQTFVGTPVNRCLDCGLKLPPAVPDGDEMDQARQIVIDAFDTVHRAPQLKAVCEQLIDRIAQALRQRRGAEVKLGWDAIPNAMACPFCKSTNIVAWGTLKDNQPCWCGFCEGCQSEGPHATTKEEAIVLWQQRGADTDGPTKCVKCSHRATVNGLCQVGVDGPLDRGGYRPRCGCKCEFVAPTDPYTRGPMIRCSSNNCGNSVEITHISEAPHANYTLAEELESHGWALDNDAPMCPRCSGVTAGLEMAAKVAAKHVVVRDHNCGKPGELVCALFIAAKISELVPAPTPETPAPSYLLIEDGGSSGWRVEAWYATEDDAGNAARLLRGDMQVEIPAPTAEEKDDGSKGD